MDKSVQKTKDIISETVAAITSTPTLTKAAELIGIQRSTLYQRMESYPEISEAVMKIKEKAHLTLANGTQKAAEVIVEGLEDKRSRYDNAKYILDGMGVTKQKDTNVQVNVLNQIKKDKTEFDI